MIPSTTLTVSALSSYFSQDGGHSRYTYPTVGKVEKFSISGLHKDTIPSPQTAFTAVGI